MATKTKAAPDPAPPEVTDPAPPEVTEPAPPTAGPAEILPAPSVGSVQLYTFGEAAPYLRLGESTLRRLISRGKIPRQFVTRIGGKLFMTGDQILRVIAQGSTVDLRSDHGARGAHRRKRPAA